MKKLSIRAQLTFWYITLLMIFLSVGVIGSYNAMYNITLNQQQEAMQKGSGFFANAIAEADDIALFFQNETDKKLPEELYFLFFDQNDHPTYGKSRNWMESLPPKLEEFQIFEHNEEHWATYDIPVYKSGEYIGWLRTAVNSTNAQNVLLEMREKGLLAIIPSLILCALGGFFITRWALKPIQKVANTAKEIGAGNFSKRIELKVAKDEIGQLLTEFNHMADNLENVIAREKQFSADASHEIRTPISVIITNAEYALQSNDLKTSQESLVVIIEKCQQMRSMLSQLMMLARENEQAAAMELEPLEINNIIHDIRDERQNRADEKKIQIQLDLENTIMIEADLMLFSRMITNLLDNAIQYGKIEGKILIKTQQDLQKKHAIIEISDDGIGIPQSALPAIFDRFYRVDQSRSDSGSGLGLSFVDFIVKLHKGSISVTSDLDKGTTFIIRLPLAG